MGPTNASFAHETKFRNNDGEEESGKLWKQSP